MNFESGAPVDATPALLETLYGRLPQGVAIIDDALRLIYANRSWSTFVEQTASSAAPPAHGRSFTDLLADDDELGVAALRCVRTGETYRLPGLSRAAGGGERFWDVTLAPLMDGSRVTGVICLVDDANGG